MTIHVPRWVLMVGALVLVAAGAYLVGRGSSADSEADSPGANEVAAEDEGPPCDRETAEELVRKRSPLPEQPLAAGESVLDFYELKLVGCGDLTDDGVEEMVIRLLGSTASGLSPWIIYSTQEGRWRQSLVREISTRDSVRLTDSGVRETTGAYAALEPLCCPSGKRTGTVVWDGGRYSYLPRAGIGDGKIRFSDGAVISVGAFPVQTGSLDDAIEVFGEPSSYYPDQELCTSYWSDIGLIINFVNLGGANACGPSGAVGLAIVSGDHAEQAGWELESTDLAVGSTQDQVRDAFPRMRPSPFPQSSEQQGAAGKDWTLVARPSPYTEGKTPSLSVRLQRGKVVGYVMSVGAGGE